MGGGGSEKGYRIPAGKGPHAVGCADLMTGNAAEVRSRDEPNGRPGLRAGLPDALWLNALFQPGTVGQRQPLGVGSADRAAPSACCAQEGPGAGRRGWVMSVRCFSWDRA